MPVNEWREIVGEPIPSEKAWRILDDWRVKRKEIGLLYCGRSGTAIVSILGSVRSTRNGLLQFKGEGAGVSLTLKQAKFSYGPMEVWPRWPAPPTVEVMALQAYIATGEWLVLAEGYVPRELAPLALPM